MSIADLYEIYKSYPHVQTDTRQLKKGDLYFALKGPNFNGNEFALQALEQGAAYAIVDEPVNVSEHLQKRILLVEDVLTCLQALAKFHRAQFNIPFIAITGSNGKTTTKELVAAVLSSHYKIYTTKGNLNNHIGVPLTLLSIQQDAQFAIIEMGANHIKEIASYCSYTLPTHGMITNCGKAHLEGFGSEEGVRKGKGELFDYLRAHQGTVFLMQDFDYLVKMAQDIPHIIGYGKEHGQIKADAIDHNGMLTVQIKKGIEIDSIQTHLVGNYNLPNVLAAVAIGHHFKVPNDKIKLAIENYIPTNSRSQLLTWNKNEVILDAYNANPSSMKLAVENFAKMNKENKIVCLGGMRELGADTLMEHQMLIDQLKQTNWKQVLLVGSEFKPCIHNFLYFDTVIEAKVWLQAQELKGNTLLIKGSRGIQMEQLIAP
ncbi:MAG: UDP-N-acetylmuramoyl-tripeptide--D-alanyl-D-alanine ligase [Chitinophagaceae bacterium]|nr:UDP-N-acetylmuramoyl-tripeptide--D-alanyl-D-alanine ligase [Chitinophagaceae bacterium]